jgi:sugar phosphate isomerase/epimerase
VNGKNLSRKTFINLVGIGAAALSMPGFALAKPKTPKPRIGFQLYSVRKQIEKDFEVTIQKIAAMGYQGVETYALPTNIDLKHAAEVFKKNGLEVFSMHTELPVGDQRGHILELADAYGCKRVVYAGWPQGEKYKDKEAIEKTAAIYNEVAAFLKTKDLKFGLHNHWWEFELVDNIYPFYYLLEHLDKSIFFELDTYWIKAGGMTPSKVVRDFGSRAPLLHIKDGPGVKGDKAYEQVPVGKGTMDFIAISEAGKISTQWMIVEFDEYAGDIFEGLQSSYTWLTENGLVQKKA